MKSLLAWLMGIDPSALDGAEIGFRFNQSPEGWVVFVLALAVVGFTWWVYRNDGRGTASAPFRFLLGLLRVSILALALLIFAEPLLLATHVEQRPSTVLVLVDDTVSMDLKFAYADEHLRKIIQEALGPDYKLKYTPEGGTPLEVPAPKLELPHFSQISRIQVACQALRKGAPSIIARLQEEHPVVKVYAFSRYYQPPGEAEGAKSPQAEGQGVVDLSKELEARVPETRIGEVLRLALKELRNAPLAGVLVISDGRQNAGEDPVQVASTQYRFQHIPIFTVGVGDPSEPKDVEVTVQGPEVVLPDDPTEVVAEVRMTGYDRLANLRVEMKTEDGKPVLFEGRPVAETITLTRPGEKVPVTLKFKESKPGRYSYVISVPKQEGEMREENNRAIHNVQVVDKKVRVLYVEGTDLPRWEYRFLKNALIRDHTTEADVLLATTAPGGDVVFLYEGSPIPDKKRLDSFPLSKKEMEDYDVLILGDVNPGLLTSEQIGFIVDFVRDGGGLLLIAGERYLPAAYDKVKPIAEMLPILPTAGYQTPPEGLNDPFRLVLTEEGKRQTWTQLDADPNESLRFWVESQPPQYWYFPVRRAKATAVTLAVHPTHKDETGKPMPLVVLGQAGGRVLYVGVDSLWRWRLGVGDRYSYRFYNQAIRFLAMGKRLGGVRRFRMDADKTAYIIGDRVTLTAYVKNTRNEPAQEATVPIRLKNPKGETQTVLLTRRRDQEGVYEYQFYATIRGSYRAVLGDEQKPEDPAAEVVLKVEPPQLEMDNPRMDEKLLRALAGAGGEGGTYVSIAELNQLPPLIHPRKDEVSRERSEPLWDKWLVMAVFTLLITTEWLLRKRGRML